MQHHPIGSFDWRRIIKRAELPRTTKLIAEFLSDFADADGSNAHPGVKLLASMAGVTERTVVTHLKRLREAGLIEKTKHSRMLESADVYQLTVPGADHAPIVMRLDPNGARIPVAPERTAHDALELVDNSVDNPVDNRSEGHSTDSSYMKPGAALSETGRSSRRSWLHPTNQTNLHQPISGLPQVGNSLGAVDEGDQGNESARGGFEPDDGEYAAANEILMSLGDIEPFMTEAIAELAAAGIADPTVRQIAVRAADFATRPAIPDPGSAQHARPGHAHDSAAPQL
ncbi:helix-turn-helix domain-containing protein [Catenulispora pinisilvae]|uniref:helix-turn-helix domain-containing protein n=1 Tax=Catenulispora pinisilvae TaxID=2705253 RepID=UPI0018923ABB|nr:helix-turn-helix domain-containing protein [Catenulispora pinisilvae]